MKIDKYSIAGEKLGEAELSDAVFSDKINDSLIYEYINAANANMRQGTHKTKERAEVRGGGSKPWRQKGTGRARAGTSRSPIWTGGGAVFGPRVRSYRKDLPKKMRRKAFCSILSLKAKEGKVCVVEDFTVESGKTKDMHAILKALDVTRGVLVSHSDDAMVRRSLGNIKDVKYNNALRLSGRDIFFSKKVLMTESALAEINKKFA